MQAQVAQLIGQPLWYVTRRPSSPMTLAFGDRVARRRAGGHPAEHAAYRSHRGQFELTLYCPWRLERGDQLVVGAGDEPAALVGLDACVDHPVGGVSVDPRFGDLTLTFEGGLVLRVFPARAAVFESWILATPTGALCVGPGSAWELQPPTDA